MATHLVHAPTGTWQLAYSNGHRSTWTIDAHGNVSGSAQDGPGRARLVYGLTGIYRPGVVELIDIKGDTLYVTHYMPENPRAPLTATGTRVSGFKTIVGEWDLVYTNGHRTRWSIDHHGHVRGSAQDGPGNSTLQFGLTSIYRAGVVEIIEPQGHALKITHYMPENWAGVIHCTATR